MCLSDAFGEQPCSAGHQEQQESERETGNDDGDPNAELRPLELLLARQTISPSAQDADLCPVALTARNRSRTLSARPSRR